MIKRSISKKAKPGLCSHLHIGSGRGSVNLTVFREVILSEKLLHQNSGVGENNRNYYKAFSTSQASRSSSYRSTGLQFIAYILCPLCVCQNQILVIRLKRADHLHSKVRILHMTLFQFWPIRCCIKKVYTSIVIPVNFEEFFTKLLVYDLLF